LFFGMKNRPKLLIPIRLNLGKNRVMTGILALQTRFND
jgi:hypothetical protein